MSLGKESKKQHNLWITPTTFERFEGMKAQLEEALGRSLTLEDFVRGIVEYQHIFLHNVVKYDGPQYFELTTPKGEFTFGNKTNILEALID